MSTVIFAALSGFYFILLLIISSALRALKKENQKINSQKVSIIIAARNEARRIHTCLDSLTKLDYPREKHEVIIVDDSSTDETPEIAGSFCEKFPNWHLVQIGKKSRELRGKKNALREGINKAGGDLIFTTDADCVVPPSWIKKMIHYFQQDVSMVIGFSPLLPGRGFWYRFFEFDTLFSAIVAAASAGIGYAYTSTGRNLAYRRIAYLDSGGFNNLKKYRSGDDMHLTRLFRDKKIGKIRYCADPDTFVETQPPQNFAHVFQQQIRKNSKILRNGLLTGTFTFLLFLYHFLFYFLPLITPGNIIPWAFLIIMKLSAEYFVLRRALHIFEQKQLNRFLPLVQLIYPVFIIFFGILGVFQKYEWKE